MSRYLFTSEHHRVDVEVDLASQVLELEADDLESFWTWRERAARRLSGKTDDDCGIAALDSNAPIEPLLSPTLPGIQQRWSWVPAMAFLLKAKAFDDGLCAAVELMAQDGTPALIGRRRLLERVYQCLEAQWSPQGPPELTSASVVVGAALSMTDKLEPHDKKHRLLVAKTVRLIKEFGADPFVSKPMGFYTWSTELEALFKQGRLLQTELEPNAASHLHAALESDASLLAAWRGHLLLASRLTNPASKPSLDEEGD